MEISFDYLTVLYCNGLVSVSNLVWIGLDLKLDLDLDLDLDLVWFGLCLFLFFDWIWFWIGFGFGFGFGLVYLEYAAGSCTMRGTYLVSLNKIRQDWMEISSDYLTVLYCNGLVVGFGFGLELD